MELRYRGMFYQLDANAADDVAVGLTAKFRGAGYQVTRPFDLSATEANISLKFRGIGYTKP